MKVYRSLRNPSVFSTMHTFALFLFDDRRVPKDSGYHRVIANARRHQISFILQHTFVLFIGAAIFLMHPAYLILNGHRAYIFSIDFIGIDATASYAYCINIGLQLCMCLMSVMGLIGMDVFFIESISVLALGNDLVAHNCQLLNALCDKGNNSKYRIEQKFFLRNIILQIQDNDE